MSRSVHRYSFSAAVDLNHVEVLIALAIENTESLYGEPRVRLESAHLLDVQTRTLVVEATAEVGRDLNKLVIGALTREVGPNEFRVLRVTIPAPFTSSSTGGD
jgi:hypothetical protein